MSGGRLYTCAKYPGGGGLIRGTLYTETPVCVCPLAVKPSCMHAATARSTESNEVAGFPFPDLATFLAFLCGS